MLLQEKIKNKISATNDKLISFSAFMHMCLYDLDHGYYSSKKNQFGSQGDFFTAPLLGKIFSRSLTKQILDCFLELDKNIIEIGAGNGQLAKDLIVELTEQNLDLKKYYIQEKSLILREQQQIFLKNNLSKDQFDKVQWINDFPDNYNGVIIANELFDAIPTNVFETSSHKIYERCVAFEENKFLWRTRPCVSKFDYQLTLPSTNIIFEYSDLYKELMESFSKTQKSIFFIIDYGMEEHQLFHPQRLNGTFRGFVNNRLTSDVLANVGNQDITYHVNFTHLAFLSKQYDMNILGYTSQSHFFNNLGIDFIDHQSTQAHYQQLSEINVLTSPSEMGELVKVMAIANNNQMELKGFGDFDRTHLL